MNRKVYYGIAVAFAVLFCSVMAWQAYQWGATMSYDADEGDISSALLGDIANVTATSDYTIPALSVMGDGGLPGGHLVIEFDRMMVRAATSQEAAESFARDLDWMYIQNLHEQGIYEFTTRAYFVGHDGIMVKNSMTLGSETLGIYTDVPSGSYHDSYYVGPNSEPNLNSGDSNKSCNEVIYDAKVSSKEFKTYDYKAFDADSILIDGSYSDIQDELNEIETETEFDDYGNQFVAAGFDDTAAAMEEVIKGKIASYYEIPIGSITLTNYTVLDVFLETEISESLADAVRDAYDDAASAAMIGTASFWNKFKEKTPLKLGRMQIGKKLTSWSQGVKNGVTKAKAQTCDKVRGMTKTMTKLSLGDKLRKGWNKFTNSTKTTLTKLKDGTTKFVKKSFGVIGSIWKRFSKIAIFVFIVLAVLVATFIYFNKGNFGATLQR